MSSGGGVLGLLLERPNSDTRLSIKLTPKP
jgi:hypothetical protein